MHFKFMRALVCHSAFQMMPQRVIKPAFAGIFALFCYQLTKPSYFADGYKSTITPIHSIGYSSAKLFSNSRLYILVYTDNQTVTSTLIPL